MLVLLFTINLLRGDGKSPSIIGVKRCENIDWVLFGTLIVLSTLITVTAIAILRKEYEYKKSIDYPFVQGDFKCTNRSALKLTLVGLGGGFVVGSVGIGIGTLFIPVLIQLDLHAVVATQTAHYVSMMTNIAAAIIVILMKRLFIEYSIIINILVVCGSFPGIFYQQMILAKSDGKQQYGIFVLFIVMILILVAVPPLAAVIMKHRHENNEDLLSADGYC